MNEEFVNRIALSEQDTDSEFNELKSQQILKQDGSEVRMFIQTQDQQNDCSETRF